MKKIEVSESALESLKAMAHKLQEERDMLLAILREYVDIGDDDDHVYLLAKDAIAACQESTKVME